MKGLPDSAIIGTLGRIKHFSNKSHKAGKAKAKTSLPASTFAGSCDPRSFEEILEIARRHAETKKGR